MVHASLFQLSTNSLFSKINYIIYMYNLSLIFVSVFNILKAAKFSILEFMKQLSELNELHTLQRRSEK